MNFSEYNVLTGQTSVIRDFSKDYPDGDQIINDVEGDSSADSRYWAWMVLAPYNGTEFPILRIITYDKQTDHILGVLDYAKYKSMGGKEASLPRPNMVDISPLGTKVVCLFGRTDTSDAFDGPHAYDLDFSHPVKVGNDENHSGWAFDQNGDEVFVTQINDNNWANAPADTIAYTNIRTGETHVIIFQEDIGWDTGFHFGRFYDPNIRGWAYMTSVGSPTSSSWMGSNAVMLELKDYTQHPRVWRIADLHNNFPATNDVYSYEREAYSPITRDGETIYWGADWPNGDGTVDTYKVRLPDKWWETLSSGETLTSQSSSNQTGRNGPIQSTVMSGVPTSRSTYLTNPGIAGFPIESILAGLFIGALLVVMNLWRRNSRCRRGTGEANSQNAPP
jgi:hypothetical protein